MFKVFLHTISLAVSFVLGYWVHDNAQISMQEQESRSGAAPAYLVAGWNLVAPEKLGPFNEAVIPLANKAGYELFAATEPKLLEGSWPYSGIVIVQQYDSMAALDRFWKSAEHNEVKGLREGHIESYFVIAVEGFDFKRETIRDDK